jgi:predicted 3-demethylubiquinone-9 3-methyltransferase (glyoxalase superfamily)
MEKHEVGDTHECTEEGREMTDTKIRPFLMFEGKAEEAFNFYASLFPGAEVLGIVRYGPNGPGVEGSVMKASFRIGGQTVLCTDSFVKHEFSFTPAFSYFVECDSEDEIRQLHAALVAGGNAPMPLGEYGFSRMFAWVSDRYGVSWQLNLV